MTGMLTPLYRRYCALPEWARLLILILSIAALGAAILWVPEWQVKQVRGLQPVDFIQSVDEHRRTLIQSLGALGALILIWLTWRRTTATEKNVLVLQEGQITERFTRAIDQLGKEDQVDIRLGGIYALEQIANDSPQKYHWTIFEILTAYVRQHSPSAAHEAELNKELDAPLDFQAIATIIRRRQRYPEPEGLHLNGCDFPLVGLSEANLRQANLISGDFRRANLNEANLSEAELCMANLSGAFLKGANLSEAELYMANLSGAHLERANLSGANLSGADLGGAHAFDANLSGASLERANLSEASLSGADLSGANLKAALGLTQDQVNSASGNSSTSLPNGIERPSHWG